ncbi:hypothetical protein ANO11243_031950 [Dothideomycetidae sp. 11243]|nr:hypothetical protein ANO11243_031950 [fungal sp. No.11243]
MTAVLTVHDAGARQRVRSRRLPRRVLVRCVGAAEELRNYGVDKRSDKAMFGRSFGQGRRLEDERSSLSSPKNILTTSGTNESMISSTLSVEVCFVRLWVMHEVVEVTPASGRSSNSLEMGCRCGRPSTRHETTRTTTLPPPSARNATTSRQIYCHAPSISGNKLVSAEFITIMGSPAAWLQGGERRHSA